jgi:uncharacterized membrane protein YkoI
MRLTSIICSIATAGLLAAGLTACETEKQEQAKLEARARITKADAEKIALAKVSGGTIKEGGLEEENGKLIYSFDLATPGSKDITEVQVDAQTGEVVSVAAETPAQQEKEKQEDAKKK